MEGEEGEGASRALVVVYALIGNVFLAVMQILIKQATTVLSPFQVLYFRSVFVLFISLLTLRQSNKSPYIQPRSGTPHTTHQFSALSACA